jgi:quercetin dioxygenase-like cupin family protein
MSQITFYPDWKEKVVYSVEGPQPQPIMETEHFKVVVVGFLAGQKMALHPAPSGVYHFIEGTGWMSVNDEHLPVGPGAIVIVPPDAKRGFEATTELSFFVVLEK